MSSTVSYHVRRPHITERVENYYRTSENIYKVGNSSGSNWNDHHRLTFGKSDIYELWVEVPGYKPEDISVSIKDDLLVVSGRHEEQDSQHGFHSREFTNKYSLPKYVDKDKMTCVFKDRGHLLIEAPIVKPEEPNTKTIPIKILNQSSSTTTTTTTASNGGLPTTPTKINGSSNSSSTTIANESNSNVSHV